MEEVQGETTMNTVRCSLQHPTSCQVHVMMYVQMTGILNVLEEKHGPDQLKMLNPQRRL